MGQGPEAVTAAAEGTEAAAVAKAAPADAGDGAVGKAGPAETASTKLMAASESYISITSVIKHGRFPGTGGD